MADAVVSHDYDYDYDYDYDHDHDHDYDYDYCYQHHRLTLADAVVGLPVVEGREVAGLAWLGLGLGLG